MEDKNKKWFIKILTDTAMELGSNTNVELVQRNVGLMVDELSKTLSRMTTAEPNTDWNHAIDHYSETRLEDMKTALNFEFVRTRINNNKTVADFKVNGVCLFPEISLTSDAQWHEAKQMQMAVIVVESITLVLHLIGVSIREVHKDDMKRVFFKVRDELAAGTSTLEQNVENIRSYHPGNDDSIRWPIIKYMLTLVGKTYESEFLFEILKTFFPWRSYSFLSQSIAKITGFIGMLDATTDGFRKLAMIIRLIVPKSDGDRFMKHIIAYEEFKKGKVFF